MYNQNYHMNPPNLQNEAQKQFPQPASSESPFVIRTETGFINLEPVDIPQSPIPLPKNENFIQQQPSSYFPLQQIPQTQHQVEQKAKLVLTKKLGNGAFGEVYLSKFDNSGEIFATKMINKHMRDNRLIKYFEMEIKILENLKRYNNPNIIKFIQKAQDNNYYYITMEYINGGSLKDCLTKYKAKYKTGFNEKIVQYLMKQIISAMVLLHDLNIIHRDLKLDNIMVNFDNEIDKKELNMMKAKVKIIDFGCAIILPQNAITHTVIGTLLNMDPNIIAKYYNQAKDDKNRGYGVEADIWSLGCLCYELDEGEHPFKGETPTEIMKKIHEGTYPLPIYTSNEFRSFLDKMLKYDPKCRLTARELLNEPFLIKNVNDFVYNNYEENNNFQGVVPPITPLSIENQDSDENINGNQINFGFTSLYGDKM